MLVLVPLCKTDTQTVANRFLAEVMNYYGLPATIVSVEILGSKEVSGKS